MVRYGKEPKLPWDALARDLSDMRKVVWSMVGAGGVTSSEEREAAFELSRQFPNITGLIFDDFWGNGKPVLSMEEMEAIRARATFLDLDLWSVCYVRELFALDIKPYLRLFDKHILWTWDPFHLASIEDKLDRFERLVDARYMGVYLWDYSRGRPMPLALLQKQCQEGLRRMKQNALQGMVFLATCICDLDIEAVHWVRSWIADVGDQFLPLEV